VLVRFQTEHSARFLFRSAESDRSLLFVNSLPTATLVSRVSSAVEISSLVTGFGNREWVTGAGRACALSA
jgi:hypothetical protein